MLKYNCIVVLKLRTTGMHVFNKVNICNNLYNTKQAQLQMDNNKSICKMTREIFPK